MPGRGQRGGQITRLHGTVGGGAQRVHDLGPSVRVIPVQPFQQDAPFRDEPVAPAQFAAPFPGSRGRGIERPADQHGISGPAGRGQCLSGQLRIRRLLFFPGVPGPGDGQGRSHLDVSGRCRVTGGLQQLPELAVWHRVREQRREPVGNGDGVGQQSGPGCCLRPRPKPARPPCLSRANARSPRPVASEMFAAASKSAAARDGSGARAAAVS